MGNGEWGLGTGGWVAQSLEPSPQSPSHNSLRHHPGERHHTDHWIHPARRWKETRIGNEQSAHAEYLAARVAHRRLRVAAHAAGAHLMRAEQRGPVAMHRFA